MLEYFSLMLYATLFYFSLDVVGVIDFVQGRTVYNKGNEERSHVKFEITNSRFVIILLTQINVITIRKNQAYSIYEQLVIGHRM